MAKLFIFAIGGTGSRVVKALTMLMACGVEIKNTEKIIPIIIDPDSANGDLTRTEEILRLYRSIHRKTFCNKSHFYKTSLKSLDEIQDTGFVSDHFNYEIDGVKDQSFKDFIGFSELDRSNKAFTSLLFSNNNLNADMDMGFKGNPNIGSVVLNKFRDSNFFQEFAESYGENDRIFIISSIFGGTGAAGFPLILKNIRGAQPPTPNHVNLQNAKIGAITVLPYFSINDTGKNTEIDSNTFISKTKAALSYYAKNVSASMNALYYIGDDFTNNRLEGADGAANQKNKAHFIELASALAIIDFMAKHDDDFNTRDGIVQNPKYYEYGLKNATSQIAFKDLGDISRDAIAKNITKYAIFEIFFSKYFNEPRKDPYRLKGNNLLQKHLLDKRFVEDITKFNQYFEEWLQEMGRCTVAFNAINLSVSQKDFLNLVTSSPEKTKFMETKGLEAMIEELNRTDEKENFDSLGDNNKKLLATFAHATDKLINKKISI